MLDVVTLACLGLGILVTGISLRNWRYGVYGLLLFLPFSGIPTIVLYPAPAVTRAIKDLVFIGPAYLGFLAWKMRRPQREALPLTLFGLCLALTALALVHLFDTDLKVAFIGLKTWVFYLPLIALAYHLVDSVADLAKLMRVLFLVGMVPIGLGVLQAVLYYGGAPDLAYGIYGAAAYDVTQGFSRFEVGTGDLARMASTFTFVSQYYNFTLAMLCLAYGHWRSLPKRSSKRFVWGFAPLALVALAGLLTGARGAFVMVPLFLVVAMILNAEWIGAFQVVMLLGSGVMTTLLLFKTTSLDLFDAVRELAVDYLTVTQVGELSRALSTTLWGLGTGTNTGPARFAISDPGAIDPTAITLENYFAKAIMEFGVPGLIVIVLLFTTVLWHGYKASRSVTNPVVKVYANAFVAFLIVSVVNEWKGAYLDIDPLNVYFWFFVGLLLRLPTLTAQPALAQPLPRRAGARVEIHRPRLTTVAAGSAR